MILSLKTTGQSPVCDSLSTLPQTLTAPYKAGRYDVKYCGDNIQCLEIDSLIRYRFNKNQCIFNSYSEECAVLFYI